MISHEKPLVVEKWTLSILEINDPATEFSFEVTGSVTGPDGKGSSKEKFKSNSGRVVIEPGSWNLAHARSYSKKAIPVGLEVKWETVPLFIDRYQAPAIADPSKDYSVTLIQGIENTRHVLRLVPEKTGAPLGIAAFRVYRPPLAEVARRTTPATPYTNGFVWDLAADFKNPADLPAKTADKKGMPDIWAYMFSGAFFNKDTFDARLDANFTLMPAASKIPEGGKFHHPGLDSKPFDYYIANVDNTTLSGDVRISPREHRPVVIRWMSPVNGVVSVDGLIADPSFGKVSWAIDKVCGNSQVNLGIGTQNQRFSTVESLARIPVAAGDRLYLLVHPADIAAKRDIGTCKVDFTVMLVSSDALEIKTDK